MNEVHRVLKHGGRFYAVTPAFPSASAFHDPTHVNFITSGTADYFCGEQALGRMYGFNGNFEKKRNDWAMFPEDFSPDKELSLMRKIKKWRRARSSKLSHIVWEFVCIKF
jgi:SAM-dependent methyltransferase